MYQILRHLRAFFVLLFLQACLFFCFPFNYFNQFEKSFTNVSPIEVLLLLLLLPLYLPLHYVFDAATSTATTCTTTPAAIVAAAVAPVESQT